jgi:hypothetical protein
VRWRTSFLLEVQKQLAQLGLSKCPICESDQLTTNKYPLMAFMGGLPPRAGRPVDPEAAADYLVRCECRTCGHQLLFNSERFRTGNERILVSQGSEEEEAELDQDHPL